MISFYNVVYVYVCKIGEKFGGWWSFSWLGQSKPVVWHPHCVCDCPNESTDNWTAVSVLVDSKGNTKTAY